MQSRLSISAGLVFCNVVLTASITRADGAPPAVIFSAFQEGRDVKLDIQIPKDTWHSSATRTITRIQNQVENIVTENLILADETPASEETTCGWYHERLNLDEFCAAYPNACHECDDNSRTMCVGESCDSCAEQEEWIIPETTPDPEHFCERYPNYAVDCDGDGAAECCTRCEQVLHYDVWDRCVPPGVTEYAMEDDAELGNSRSEVSDFKVTETGESCEEPSVPNSADGGGCNAAGLFSTSSTLSIFKLLFF